AGHWADLVHREGQSHCAIARHAAISGTKAADSAEGRRTDDRAPRLRADGESGEARSDDGAGTGGRTASPALGVPGIFRFALQRGGGVAIAHAAGQLDHRSFADQDGTDAVEMFDDSRVIVEDLIRVRLRAPGARYSFDGEKIFGGVRNAVERTAIVAAGD